MNQPSGGVTVGDRWPFDEGKPALFQQPSGLRDVVHHDSDVAEAFSLSGQAASNRIAHIRLVQWLHQFGRHLPGVA
jgi:hypothetical protein